MTALHKLTLPRLVLYGSLLLLINACGTTGRIGKANKSIAAGSKSGEVIEDGVASWYGPNFHGNLTANGETYDMDRLTAAHRTLPFNTIVKVKNRDNGKSVIVRINDRGPYAKNRIIDLSRGAAKKIGMIGPGTARVQLVLLEGNLKDSRVTDLKVPTYTVQLGSFDTEAGAFELSRKIKGSRVEEIKLNGSKIYRVYYGIYVDKDEASEQKEELGSRGYNGYVKQIQN